MKGAARVPHRGTTTSGGSGASQVCLRKSFALEAAAHTPSSMDIYPASLPRTCLPHRTHYRTSPPHPPSPSSTSAGPLRRCPGRALGPAEMEPCGPPELGPPPRPKARRPPCGAAPPPPPPPNEATAVRSPREPWMAVGPDRRDRPGLGGLLGSEIGAARAWGQHRVRASAEGRRQGKRTPEGTDGRHCASSANAALLQRAGNV